MNQPKNKSLILFVLLLIAVLVLSVCGTMTGSSESSSESGELSARDISGVSDTGDTDMEVPADTSEAVSAAQDDSSSKTAASTLDNSSSKTAAAAQDDSSNETVVITLNGSAAEASSEAVQISGSTVTVTEAGTYILSGTLDDGTVIVDADKEDKVLLVLEGVSIQASDYAAIYVKQADKVYITLSDGTVNSLANGGTFAEKDENDVDAVIFSKDDISFSGTGTLEISSPAGNGIVGKDDVTFAEGVYKISADGHAIRAKDSITVTDGNFTLSAGEDGLHAENSDDESLGNICITGGSFEIQVKDDAIHATTLLQIDDGTFSITAAEGLEATYILINGGDIQISASDDGVNAARKSSVYTPTFEMNDGTLTVSMGAGDTDGIDSNGNIIISGGTINVTGQSAFDYDGSAQYNGGTIIVNGQQVNSIPNQMMGGGMGGFGGGMDSGMGEGGFGGNMGGRGNGRYH